MASIFAGAIVCLLASLLLFSRRKEGERSRIILSSILLFSVFSYTTRFFALIKDVVPPQVVSVPMLLFAIFMVTSYLMYPIEVISPKWLNCKRIVKLYAPWLFLVVIYLVTRLLEIEYTPYNSLLNMLPHVMKFEVWYRLVLCLLIFIPVLSIFFIPYTRQYSNTDKVWITKYVSVVSINCFAYILVLTFDVPIIHTFYYYVSVGCSLFVVYMELFVRLIGKPVEIIYTTEQTMNDTLQNNCPPLPNTLHEKSRNTLLIEKLDAYMKETSAWRNPDLSLNTLASALCTNRTTLAQAIQKCGYENYSIYINKLRINDFLHEIAATPTTNFQEAFFDVGFRSRATALRNFRQITGMTPSEYFNKHTHS